MASRPIKPSGDERDERNSVRMDEHPYCPGCQRFASEMSELDPFINGDGEGDVMRPATAEEREDYIRTPEEGTYNTTNGHFLCDTCYLNAGMPTGPNGWTCP